MSYLFGRLAVPAVALAGLLSGAPALAAECLRLSGPAGGLVAGSVVNVLWLGNSLTNTAPDLGDFGLGPMPARLASLLSRLGIQLRFEVRLRGGAEFGDHARDRQTMALLGERRFDAVNLQGYYAGYASASAFREATRELLTAMAAGRATPLFQAVWTFQGDPGSPQFPVAAAAVEEAARQTPGAQAVPVMRVWEAVRLADAALHRRLYADNTHQSAIGEHLNALIYARFFSGRSVRGLAPVLPKVRTALTAAEQALLEELTDREVRLFFRPAQAC